MTELNNILADQGPRVSKSITIDLEIRPVNAFHAFLQRIRLRPKIKRYYLKPVTMASMIQISDLLLSIDITLYDIRRLMESNYKVLVKHGEAICKVVAIAIHGTKGEVPQRLVDTIVNNLTMDELEATLRLVLRQMEVEKFMLSIMSVKGMNILEMNPGDKVNQSIENLSVVS